MPENAPVRVAARVPPEGRVEAVANPVQAPRSAGPGGAHGASGRPREASTAVTVAPAWAARWRAARVIVLFLLCLAGMAALFAVLPSDHRAVEVFARPSPDGKEFVIESAKEFSALATLLTGLSTGMFVLLALVARRFAAPARRCPLPHAVVLTVFIAATAAGLFMAAQVKLAAAYGIFARGFDPTEVARLVGGQAWCTVVAAAAVVALVADAFMTHEPGQEGR